MVDKYVMEGNITLEKTANIAILATRWNSFIVDRLEEGCVNVLERSSPADVKLRIIRVPGAFELPVVAKTIAKTGECDAIIALGAVIRGTTAHFEHVAGACTRGLASVATDTGVPVIFGVLTTETIEQAIERAGTKAGNKGAEAGATAIEMINLLRAL
jgi:6,7-dimethyl-8-ribityllumazine synthase